MIVGVFLWNPPTTGNVTLPNQGPFQNAGRPSNPDGLPYLYSDVHSMGNPATEADQPVPNDVDLDLVKRPHGIDHVGNIPGPGALVRRMHG